mmetsp:Transcript_13894/g.35462  ORF Transcript_13894/g.35462 Transcript_13894/m.35462 type:complete len:317 (-) Transcript_13894:187-1137(-)
MLTFSTLLMVSTGITSTVRTRKMFDRKQMKFSEMYNRPCTRMEQSSGRYDADESTRSVSVSGSPNTFRNASILRCTFLRLCGSAPRLKILLLRLPSPRWTSRSSLVTLEESTRARLPSLYDLDLLGASLSLDCVFVILFGCGSTPVVGKHTVYCTWISPYGPVFLYFWRGNHSSKDLLLSLSFSWIATYPRLTSSTIRLRLQTSIRQKDCFRVSSTRKSNVSFHTAIDDVLVLQGGAFLNLRLMRVLCWLTSGTLMAAKQYTSILPSFSSPERFRASTMVALKLPGAMLHSSTVGCDCASSKRRDGTASSQGAGCR